MHALQARLRHPPAVVVVLALGLFWGAGFPAIDLVVQHVPPLTAAAARYLVSGLLVLGYAAVATDHLVPRTRRELAAVAVVGVSTFGGYQAGLYLGTEYISGATAAVVTSLSPVLTALLAVPLLGESRTPLDGLGFLLGIGGVAIIARPPVGGDALSASVLGVALVLAGTSFLAVGVITIQSFEGALPIEALQGWAMLFGALVLFAGARGRAEPLDALAAMPTDATLALAYITLVGGAGGYLTYFWLVRRTGATDTTLVAYIEPVGATLVSVAVFGQSVAVATVGGFLAVAAGFLVVRRDLVAARWDPRSTLARLRRLRHPAETRR